MLKSASSWQRVETNNVTNGRKGHSSIVYDNERDAPQIVLFWGGSWAKFVPTVSHLDMDRLEWTSPSYRYTHRIETRPSVEYALAQNGREVFLFGGIQERDAYYWLTNQLARVDIVTNAVNLIFPERHSPELPSPRAAATLTYVPETPDNSATLLLFGGFDKSQSPLSDMFQFDLNRGLWTRIKQADLVPAPRESHSAVYYVSKSTGIRYIVVYGGSASKHRDGLAELWMFNLDTFKWENPRLLGAEPPAVFMHSAALFHHFLVIDGGARKSSSGRIELSDATCAINLESFEVTYLVRSPESACNHSSVIVGNTLYRTGGLVSIEKEISSQRVYALELGPPLPVEWSFDRKEKGILVKWKRKASSGTRYRIFASRAEDNPYKWSTVYNGSSSSEYFIPWERHFGSSGKFEFGVTYAFKVTCANHLGSSEDWNQSNIKFIDFPNAHEVSRGTAILEDLMVTENGEEAHDVLFRCNREYHKKSFELVARCAFSEEETRNWIIKGVNKGSTRNLWVNMKTLENVAFAGDCGKYVLTRMLLIGQLLSKEYRRRMIQLPYHKREGFLGSEVYIQLKLFLLDSSRNPKYETATYSNICKVQVDKDTFDLTLSNPSSPTYDEEMMIAARDIPPDLHEEMADEENGADTRDVLEEEEEEVGEGLVSFEANDYSMNLEERGHEFGNDDVINTEKMDIDQPQGSEGNMQVGHDGDAASQQSQPLEKVAQPVTEGNKSDELELDLRSDEVVPEDSDSVQRTPAKRNNTLSTPEFEGPLSDGEIKTPKTRTPPRRGKRRTPLSVDSGSPNARKKTKTVEVDSLPKNPGNWMFDLRFGANVGISHEATNGTKTEPGWYAARVVNYVTTREATPDDYAPILLKVHWTGWPRTSWCEIDLSRRGEETDEEWINRLNSIIKQDCDQLETGGLPEESEMWDAKSSLCILQAKLRARARNGDICVSKENLKRLSKLYL